MLGLRWILKEDIYWNCMYRNVFSSIYFYWKNFCFLMILVLRYIKWMKEIDDVLKISK